MQTLTFFGALDAIVRDLRLPELAAILGPYVEPLDYRDAVTSSDDRTTFDRLVFDFRGAYELLKKAPETAELLSAFGLDRLAENENLSEMLAAFRTAGSRSALRGHAAYPRFARFFYAATALVNLRDTVSRLLVVPKLEAAGDDLAGLNLEIVDYDDGGVTVERLRGVLDSLQALYDTVAREVEPDGKPLRVGYVDSGSDLMLALIGAPITMRIMGGIFAAAWSEVRHWRANTHDRNIESFRKAIDVLGIVGEHAQTGKLTEEDARRIQTIVIANTFQLIGAGVMMKGVEEEQRFDRRASLAAARDVKQISPGNQPEGESPSD